MQNVSISLYDIRYIRMFWFLNKTWNCCFYLFVLFTDFRSFNFWIPVQCDYQHFINCLRIDFDNHLKCKLCFCFCVCFLWKWKCFVHWIAYTENKTGIFHFNFICFNWHTQYSVHKLISIAFVTIEMHVKIFSSLIILTLFNSF